MGDRMITRTQAERIAQSINAIRRDWPTASLLTFIVDNLTDWSLLDAYVGLAYIAIERTPDGSQWATKTPARIKENGPWRRIDIENHVDAAKTRAAEELAERKQAVKIRQDLIAACTICNDEGRLENGWLCRHDLDLNERAQRAAARASQARAEIRHHSQRTTQ